ncbi:MAG: hypothetical protein ACR2LA_03785 [Acidimicrobiales bacterium]
MTTTTPTATSTEGASAADRLASGAGDLHVPEPSGDAEAMLLKIGFALPLVGVALMLVAWWNSAGTKYVADQVPMLISGGLVGTGLILVGVGLFVRFSMARLFRFWLARLVAEQQAQTDRLVAALEGVESAVRDAADDTSGRPGVR